VLAHLLLPRLLLLLLLEVVVEVQLLVLHLLLALLVWVVPPTPLLLHWPPATRSGLGISGSVATVVAAASCWQQGATCSESSPHRQLLAGLLVLQVRTDYCYGATGTIARC
jgi:hypothetical protein